MRRRLQRVQDLRRDVLGLEHLVEAVEHFRYYLLPNPNTTELITDHESLKYLLTAKQLSDVLTRYAMRLSEFDIELKHHGTNYQ